MAHVEFQHVDKSFGQTQVLDQFNLRVEDSAFLALLGPSGSGKSTALRLLAGLEEPSDGAIYIGDRMVNRMPPRDRDIAMVFQSYALYPHMSVFDNIAFGLSLRGLPRPTIQQRVTQAAEQLDISPLLQRKPGQLSGGQRQRVALARAIVREPSVFLLDEPLSNLDAQLRVQTRAELIKLHQRLGTTFIYVTHDQVEAMTMATEIAVIDQGTVQQIGSPQALYEHPANVFVAGFIGSPSMNLLEADVHADGDTVALTVDGLAVPVSGERRDALAASGAQKVLLGVRPEHVHSANFVPPQTDTQPFPATVDIAEWLGDELLLHVAAGDTTLLARVDPRLVVAQGDKIDLAVDIAQIHAFDPTTTKAIF